MKYNKFAKILFGIFLVGASVGYVLGFYVHKYTMNNDLFYLSILFMAIGCFMIIYATLFKK